MAAAHGTAHTAVLFAITRTSGVSRNGGTGLFPTDLGQSAAERSVRRWAFGRVKRRLAEAAR